MSEFIFHSKRTVTTNGIQDAFVWIRDGVIKAVSDTLPTSNVEQIDVGDNIIMPGVIDPHVHINEPGRTEWEGFETATRAALSGGITTLVDMPLNASPVTTSVSAFEKKVASSKHKLFTN